MPTNNNRQQQPQAGPIAQQLAVLHSNAPVAASPSAGQQPMTRQQRKRMWILVASMAVLLISTGILLLAKQPWYIVIIPIIPMAVGLLLVGYEAKWTGFSEYTSPIHPEHTEFQRSKTLWDWLQLWIIPLVLAGGGFWFSAQQNQTSLQVSERQHQADLQIAATRYANDQQLAADQQRETTLQTYLDNMSDLLLKQNLAKSQPGDEVSQVARERTLTTLRRLDANHNKIVLQFLQDAHLIGRNATVIDLSQADLSGDDLKGVNLSFTELSQADLHGADLRGARLYGADLRFFPHTDPSKVGADLQGANLRGADLRGADLRGANLRGTNLNGADLSDPTLTFSSHVNPYLHFADLSNADLDGADLRGADLNGVHLSSALLNDANLSDANLSDAHLNNAFLVSANLRNVNLIGADLSEAGLSDASNLTQQQLDQVYTCKGAILPKGLTCHHNR